MEWWIIARKFLNYYCIFAGVIVYFIPSYMAFKMGNRNAFAILVLNVLGGWTIIGWILAMVWCSNGNDRESLKQGK
mgnify:CR=1 FL=1